jgi:hypothetical protein
MRAGVVVGPAVGAVIAALLAVVHAPGPALHALPTLTSRPLALYVSPHGSDRNKGTAVQAAFRTIQRALNAAKPGTTIHLAAGLYRERPTTVRSGTAKARIVIQGPERGKAVSGRYRAVLYGTGRIFNINNSYYTLDGFTIDGQEALRGTPYAKTRATVRAFKDRVQRKVRDGRLVYIGSANSARNVTGVVIRNMFLSGAGGECVRVRNSADHNTIKTSVIQWCGMSAAGNDVTIAKYHNGEGVYIGTSPKSSGQPMHTNDDSAHNVVADNLIVTNAAECFDVKENAHDNSFVGNVCRNNDEPLSFGGSNIEVRGYHNVISGNDITGSRGNGIKLKSDSARYRQGGNLVRKNRILHDAGAPVLNDQSHPQGRFCGNKFDNPTMPVLRGHPTTDPRATCPLS